MKTKLRLIFEINRLNEFDYDGIIKFGEQLSKN